MKEKDIKALLETYREEVQNGSHWESREAYLDRCRSVYEKYCAGKTIEEQVLTWLVLLKNPLLLGVYEGFSAGDMALLNNALAQGARHGQNGAIHASGVDHSLYAFRVLPELLAANLFERVPLLLPETLGPLAAMAISQEFRSSTFLWRCGMSGRIMPKQPAPRLKSACSTRETSHIWA